MHDIAQAAADAAHVPEFGEVLARGERRRAIRHGVAAGVAALAVATVVGAVQLVGTGDGPGPEPAPSPTVPTPTVSDPVTTAVDGPSEIIDHPAAQIADAAVAEDGSATAVLWRVVNRDPYGLAVSDDGFATRSTWRLPIPGDVVVTGDRFLLRDQTMSRLWVVDGGGDRRAVEVSGPEAPVGDGEVPVATSSGLVAVDPAAGTAHPVAAPEQAFEIGTYGGRLTAITTVIDGRGQREATYHWSDDGGASWRAVSFDAGELGGPEVVPSAAGTDHTLVVRGDGATIGPLLAVMTMAVGADAFVVTEYDGEQASLAGAWVVDGELRLLADLWGDGTGPPRESGLYQWEDGGLERIPTTTPEATDVQSSELVSAVAGPDGPELLVAVEASLWQSSDGGDTWRVVPVR